MKSNITKLLTALAVVVVSCTQLSAQDQPGTGGLVTVLDVAKVFEQNPGFNQNMDQIKGEAEALKKRITTDQDLIRQEAMELQNFEVGTPERNQKEAGLEQRQTKLRTEARQSEQQLLNREATIYYDTYKLMQEVVSKLAVDNNISLVLRYDSAEIDPTNRPEVIKGVNRTIVYHKQLDLTTMVSEAMNSRTASAGAANMK